MKDIIRLAAIETAINYIQHESHAEWYLLPITQQVGAGAHGAVHTLCIAKIHKTDLLDVVQTGKGLDTKFFRVADNVLKVNKLSMTAFTKTFGNRFTIIPLATSDRNAGYRTYGDLPEDPSNCAGKRARTFEKVACRAVNARWCGSLNRVQIDGYIKFFDETGEEVKVRYEAKGLGGRITHYSPSAIDKDAKER